MTKHSQTLGCIFIIFRTTNKFFNSTLRQINCNQIAHPQIFDLRLQGYDQHISNRALTLHKSSRQLILR